MSIIRDYTINYVANTAQAVGNVINLANAQNQLTTNTNTLTGAANNNALAIGALTNQLKANHSAATAITTANRDAGKSFTELVAGIFAAQAAFYALEGAINVATSIGDGIRAARDHMKELAEEAAKFRSELREIAAIKGTQPDEQLMAETMAMGLAANMMPEDMVAFLEQFEGAIPAAEHKGNLGPNVPPQQRGKLKDDIATLGARIGNRLHISPKTSGLFSGLIPFHEGIDSPERFAEIYGQTTAILHGGVGNIENLVRGLTNIAGELVGEGSPMPDLQSLAAVYSGLSITHSNPAQAATYTRKLFRELGDFTGPQGEGLESIGITPGMPGMKAIEKMKAHLDAQMAAGIDPKQALAELGFRDQAGMTAIVEATRALDVIKKQHAQGTAVTGTQTIRETDEFFRSQKAGVTARVKSEAAFAKLDAGRPGEWLAVAREQAATKMRLEGKLAGPDLAWIDTLGDFAQAKAFTGAPSGLEQRIDERAWAEMRARLDAAGLRDEFAAQDRTWASLSEEQKQRRWARFQPAPERMAHNMNRAVELLQRHGQDPFGTTILDEKLQAEARPPRAMQERFRNPRPQPGQPGGPAGPPRPPHLPVGIDPPPGQPVAGLMVPPQRPPQPIGDLHGGELKEVLEELQAQTALLRGQQMNPGTPPRGGAMRA